MLTEIGVPGAWRGADRVDAGADLQHGDGRAAVAQRRLHHRHLAQAAVRLQLLDRHHRRLLVSRVFLAPVRQQPLHRRDDGVLHLIHRVDGELFGQPDASAQRLALDQRGAADLRDPGLVPGDPALPDHAGLWPRQQCVVGHRGRGDLCHALRDLHLPAIRPEHSDRARRGGAGRRRHRRGRSISRSICR